MTTDPGHARAKRGRLNYLAGLAAENAVARHYERGGDTTRSRRWRGRCGEIDLIVGADNGFVFVEIKKSKTHDMAAQSLSSRQQGRILRSAAEYLAQNDPAGQAEARIDVALVDQTGAIKILENAIGH